MHYSQAKIGRVFVIRLEDGEILHEAIEQFAREQNILHAALIAVGGADTGSRLVVGPKEGRSTPIEPMQTLLEGVHEITGTGTLFPNEAGEPVLHMHIASGRQSETITGCVRQGVKVWHVMEVILWELLDSTAVRRKEPASGFELMQPS